MTSATTTQIWEPLTWTAWPQQVSNLVTLMYNLMVSG